MFFLLAVMTMTTSGFASLVMPHNVRKTKGTRDFFNTVVEKRCTKGPLVRLLKTKNTFGDEVQSSIRMPGICGPRRPLLVAAVAAVNNLAYAIQSGAAYSAVQSAAQQAVTAINNYLNAPNDGLTVDRTTQFRQVIGVINGIGNTAGEIVQALGLQRRELIRTYNSLIDRFNPDMV